MPARCHGLSLSIWRLLHPPRLMRFVRAVLLVLLVPLGLSGARSALAAEEIDLPTRPGVTQRIYLTPARTPFASAVLFPGGSGVVSATRNNFLIRIAGDLAAAGVTAAVADAPSDHAGGMDTPFRSGEAQATDTASIVALLRQRAALPIWLIGTSRGSISAANAAARLGPARIAGVVLTSSVWTGGMQSVPIQQLRVPVLIVHNRDDGCRFAPFDSAGQALAGMTAAPVKQLIAVSGGSLRSGPCEALSPHGYYGIEAQVVPAIVAWIRQH